MNEPIFIARQDTLEQEILPAHWLAQYKLFGEESYTFQDKGIWKKLCMSRAAANDRDMHAEALEEMLTTFSAEHTGKWMLLVYGTNAAALEGLATMAAIAANGTAMGAVVDNALLMHAIANSETAMQRIANSQTAIQRVANNRGDGCHRQKPDCERRSAGFALLQQLHQGERHGDCEVGGCFGKPRICRLLRHGRSGRRFDRYDRRRCEFCGKKCDFGFALL